MNGRSANTTINASGDRANLTGSLDLSNVRIYNQSNSGYSTMYYLADRLDLKTFEGDVQVTGYGAGDVLYGHTSCIIAEKIDHYTYNLNGSGRIIIRGAASKSGKGLLYSTNTESFEWPTITFNVDSGNITSVSMNNVYCFSREEQDFIVNSVSISS